MLTKIYNWIKKKILWIFIGGVVFASPVIPENMTFLYAYQYPVNEYKEFIYLPYLSEDIPNPQPIYKDNNKDGVISVSVFEDKFGNKHYIQIDDILYSNMGEKGGYLENPKATKKNNLITLLTDIAEGAIARDDHSYGLATATSVTVAHTITGSNTFMMSAMYSISDDAVSLTVNGVSATQMVKQHAPVHGLYWYIYALNNPTTGNVVWTTGTSESKAVSSESYTGAFQGTPTEANGVVCSGKVQSVDDITDSVTTVADNSWIFSSAYDGGSGTTDGGTNNTMIALDDNYFATGDTNSDQTPAGSKSMQWIASGSKNWVMVMCSFAPAEFSPPSEEVVGGEEYIILFK